MIELFIRIGAGIVVIIAGIIFSKNYYVTKRPKWPNLVIKILITSISAGVAFTGVLIMGGYKDIVGLLVFGTLASIVGPVFFFSSWGSYEIYSWLQQRRLK